MTARAADTAKNADNASLLDGNDSSSFRLACPAGTTREVGVCFENNHRAAATFRNAFESCGSDSRLPTVAELNAFASRPGVTLAPATLPGNTEYEWTGNVFVDGNEQAFAIVDDGITESFATNVLATDQLGFRCVRPPSN